MSNKLREIPISEFKAKCFGILKQVGKSRQRVRVTRFGKPVAEIIPASSRERRSAWLGCMIGTGRIVGNIVSPSSDGGEMNTL